MLTVLILTGLALFGLGATTQHLSQRAEQDFPAPGRMIAAGGINQHVIEQGPADGQPLVMIHGAFGAAQDFAVSIMPETARRYRSIAVDRPGHGYSDRGEDTPVTPDKQARYLRATLQAMQVNKPILLGFSFGGAVALSYALQYPDEVGAVVLVNTASHPWPLPVELSYRIDGMPFLGPLLRYTIVTPAGHLVVDKGVEGVFKPAPVSPAYVQAPVSLSLRPSSYRANAEDIRTLKPFLAEQAQRYPLFAVPLIILVSDEDNAASPIIHSRPLAAAAPNAELIEVRGGGHPLHFTRPHSVLDAIDRAAAKAALRR
jgi:pimeloyl-ACP methyl ester carboxylesterase